MLSNLRHFYKNSSHLNTKKIKTYDKINNLCYKSFLNTEWRNKAILVNTGLLGLEIDHLQDLAKLADQRSANLYLLRYGIGQEQVCKVEERVVGTINFDFGSGNLRTISSLNTAQELDLNTEMVNLSFGMVDNRWMDLSNYNHVMRKVITANYRVNSLSIILKAIFGLFRHEKIQILI